MKCRSFEECVPTYSFRNSQPLTSDISQIEVSGLVRCGYWASVSGGVHVIDEGDANVKW